MSQSITDLLPMPEEVDLGRGKLALNGITAEHISRLLVVFKDDLLTFMSSPTPDFKSLVLAAPALVNQLIAMAADCEDQVDTVARIPIAKQVECLEKVYLLSVPDEKKFKESLVALLATLQRGRAELQAASQLGSSSEKSSESGPTT